MEYVLSFDQSTSGTKALIVGTDGELVARTDISHKQIINEKGWIEHNPSEIYTNVLSAAKKVVLKAGISKRQIKQISITNQRETSVCWDRQTHQPLHNAIVWQCPRAADIVSELEQGGWKPEIEQKTGLHLSPYFSGAKFAWMVKHCGVVSDALKKGSLCCGTIDAWLIFKLTEGASFKTDYSNASRTQLLNLDTLEWDSNTVELFGLNESCLPEICMSDACFGETTLEGLLEKPVPIHCVMGDSHAALFGNRCIKKGMAKATYGTGSSIMINAGSVRPKYGRDYATSLAWGVNGKVEYVVEGNINYCGAITKWLVEDIELLDKESQAGNVAAMVKNNGGVYIVPAFSGLGAPYFDSKVRAAFIGMSRTTKKAHLVRAAEESIAYQIKDVISAFGESAGISLKELYADGGPTQDQFLMQFQSDILEVPIHISTIRELSGIGCAFCSMLATGMSTEKELYANFEYKTVLPRMEKTEVSELYNGWKRAVEGVINI